MHASPSNTAPALTPAPDPGPAAHAQEPSDEALVVAARSGDRAAFSRLYTRYARMVHAVLISRVNPTDADDLTQDVFLRAMFRLGSLRSGSLVGPWLATIARNKAAGLRRSRWKRRRKDMTTEPVARTSSDNLTAQEVLAAIRDLPEAYRETLTMRLVELMTGPEIAARTGRSHGAVRVSLCKGMALLREKLGAEVQP